MESMRMERNVSIGLFFDVALHSIVVIICERMCVWHTNTASLKVPLGICVSSLLWTLLSSCANAFCCLRARVCGLHLWLQDCLLWQHMHDHQPHQISNRNESVQIERECSMRFVIGLFPSLFATTFVPHRILYHRPRVHYVHRCVKCHAYCFCFVFFLHSYIIVTYCFFFFE